MFIPTNTAVTGPVTFNIFTTDGVGSGSYQLLGASQGLAITGFPGGPVTVSNVTTSGTTTTATLSRTIASSETGGTLYGVAGAFTDSASPVNPNAAFSIPLSNQSTPVPTNLTAIGGLTQIKLAWTGIAGSPTYSVYRSTTAGKETLVQSGVSGTSFTDTGLTGGTYYYKVSATLSGSESALSNEASTQASDFALSANPPAVTIASGSSGTCAITVNPLGGFSGQVTLGGSSTVSGITAASTSAGPGSSVSLTVSVAKSVPPAVYTFTVTGTDSSGTVTRTTPVKVTVTSPIPTLTAIGGLTRVKLTWTSIAGNTTYTVYRSTTSGTETAYKSGLTATSFTDTGLPGGATYFYKVTATISGTENLPSNEASATVTDFTLSANPTTVTVPVGGSAKTQITVSPLGGFIGAVSLNGSSSGISVAGAAPTPNSPATIQISAAGSATPGTYSLTVIGTGNDATGSVSHTLPLTVIVVPALAVNVIWTSDATTSPVTQQASTSGQIGGNASVHLSLPLPSGASGAIATSITVHEVAAPDASHDITATNMPLSGSANSLCDPPPGLPAGWPVAYADISWPLGSRCGPYTLTISVQYTTSAGATVSQTQTLTVDREDLIVKVTSPSDPAPAILTASGSVPFTLNIQAAYKTAATATVQIFASDQTPVRTLTYPSAASPGPVIIGGSASATPLTVTWDGTKDDGTIADPGVYLYRVSVTAPNGDFDNDKSPFLGLSAPSPPLATLVSDDGTKAVYQVTYTVASSDSPAQAAQAGKIVVYDPNQKEVAKQTLVSGDLMPGLRTVNVSMGSPQVDGTYTFLTSVQDNDAAKDKAGRQRWALQENNKYSWDSISLLALSNPQQAGSPIYHVAWGHVSRLVRRVTKVQTAASHLPSLWVKGTPFGSDRAAVNGMFFDGHASTSFHIAGQAGPNWGVSNTTRQRWAFGMSESGNNFVLAKMTDPKQKGKSSTLSSAPSSVISHTYGFSEVGLLVTSDLDPVTGRIVPTHAAQAVAKNWSNNWPDPIAGETPNKTAIAWTTTGEFFLIVGPGTWNDVANFIVFTLPNDPGVVPYHIQIKEAVMLDGGTSSEFGWEVYHSPLISPRQDFLLNAGRKLPVYVGMQSP